MGNVCEGQEEVYEEGDIAPMLSCYQHTRSYGILSQRVSRHY
jgi:hypothetical protein